MRCRNDTVLVQRQSQHYLFQSNEKWRELPASAVTVHFDEMEMDVTEVLPERKFPSQIFPVHRLPANCNTVHTDFHTVDNRFR